MAGKAVPTRYSGLSRGEVDLLFSSESWASMGAADRVEACQELENRLAEADGTIPRSVMTEPMSGAGAYGYQTGSAIVINQNVIEDGVFRVDVKDGCQTQEMGVPAPNWSVYDTVCHEHQHGVILDEGRAQGDAYVSPSADWDLYRMNPEEREAYAKAEERTATAMETVARATGKTDPNQEEYIESVAVTSYEKALARAQQHYGNPQIQETLDRAIAEVRDNPGLAGPGKAEEAILQTVSESSQSQEGVLTTCSDETPAEAEDTNRAGSWETDLTLADEPSVSGSEEGQAGWEQDLQESSVAEEDGQAESMEAESNSDVEEEQSMDDGMGVGD